MLAAATSADSLRSLRGKYPGVFLLVDGLDCPGANLKNVSLAFDGVHFTEAGHKAFAEGLYQFLNSCINFE